MCPQSWLPSGEPIQTAQTQCSVPCLLPEIHAHSLSWRTADLIFLGLVCKQSILCKGECAILSRVWIFVAPWTAARQAPLSMRLPRQESWSGLPRPPPGGLPKLRIKPMSPVCPALQADFFFFYLSHQRSPSDHQLYGLKQHTFVTSQVPWWGIWARFSWVVWKVAIKVLVGAGFSSGGLTEVDLLPKPSVCWQSSSLCGCRTEVLASRCLLTGGCSQLWGLP